MFEEPPQSQTPGDLPAGAAQAPLCARHCGEKLRASGRAAGLGTYAFHQRSWLDGWPLSLLLAGGCQLARSAGPGLTGTVTLAIPHSALN